MNRCIIVGRPNVGKTAFLLRFSQFTGLKEVEIRFKTSDGNLHTRCRSIDSAYAELVDSASHTTQELQSVILQIPAGKGRKTFELMDTSGLIDGIHSSPVIRAAMAQTLEAITRAKLIIHVLDTALIGFRGLSEGVGRVDMDLADYARLQGEYLILANKMDLSGAKRGLQIIRSYFKHTPVYPVSARTMQGFKEVKLHVGRVM